MMLQQLIRRAEALPRGTWAVALGVMINGAASYVFLSVPARSGRLEPSDYSLLTTVWFVVFILGPGLFVPLEQAVARAAAARRALASDDADVVSAARRTVLVMSAVVALLGAVSAPWIADLAFDGRRLSIAVVVAAVASFGVLQAARGVSSGRAAFGAYAMLLAGEGVTRMVAAVVLVVAGVDDPLAYAATLIGSPLLAVLVARSTTSARSGSRETHTTSGPQLEMRSYGALLAAQVSAQALANSVPLALAIIATDDAGREAAGALAAGFVLSRVPLFLFQAVQAALLPALTTQIVAGDHAEAERSLLRLERLLAGLVLLALLVLVVVGPWAVSVFFGSDFAVTAADMAWFAGGGALFVVAFLHHQVLVAADHASAAALIWTVGLMLLVAGITLATWADAGSAVGRVEAVYVGSIAMVAIAMRRAALVDLNQTQVRTASPSR